MMLNGGLKMWVGAGMRDPERAEFELARQQILRTVIPGRALRPDPESRNRVVGLDYALARRNEGALSMRGRGLQRLVDIVALPSRFLVVDLHVERQCELAVRECRI